MAKYNVTFTYVKGTRHLVHATAKLLATSSSHTQYLQMVDSTNTGIYAPIIFISVNGVPIPAQYLDHTQHRITADGISRDCLACMRVRPECVIEDFLFIEV